MIKKIIKLSILMAVISGSLFATEGFNYKQESSHSKNWRWVTYSNGCHIALKKDGTLWMFNLPYLESVGAGRITHFQNFETGKLESLYDEKIVYYIKPIQIGRANNWKRLKLYISMDSVYAIKNNGTLWRWDRPAHKQTEPINLVQIGKDNNWYNVQNDSHRDPSECTEQYALGFKKDGSLWYWGFPTIDDKSKDRTPKLLGFDFDKIKMGCFDIIAQKKDGTYCSWQKGAEKNIEKIKDEDIDIDTINNFKIIPSMSIYDYPIYTDKKSNLIKKDGTLWLMPELVYF